MSLSNPNNPTLSKMVQHFETHIQDHPLPGIFFAFIAGAFSYLQINTQQPTTLESFCKVIGQISIIIGFLIAIITLIIKFKELYTTFFSNKEKVVRKRKKPVSSE